MCVYFYKKGLFLQKVIKVLKNSLDLNCKTAYYNFLHQNKILDGLIFFPYIEEIVKMKLQLVDGVWGNEIMYLKQPVIQ